MAIVSRSCCCLIGAMLIKLGQGLILTWGKTNIYFYSYYKHFDKQLDISVLRNLFQYNTLPLAFVALPAALITIFSVRLAKLVGFELLIRLCCFLQLISLLIAPNMEDYASFILFYLVIVTLCYSFQAFPLLTIVWSHYKKTEGKVTGMIFAVFGISTFGFIILITYIVNPTNDKAALEISSGHQTFQYFNFDVAENAREAARIAGIISGICSSLGSLLISKSSEPAEYNKVELEMKPPQKPQEPSLDDGEVRQNQIEINMDNFAMVMEEDLYEIPQPDRSEIKVTKSLLQALASQQFLIIVFCQAILNFFSLTLGMNYKAYALSKIHDDYFVTFVDMLALLASAASNIIWGRLSDRLSFKRLFGFAHLLCGCGAILLPFVAERSNLFFLVDYVLIMMFYKGGMVIVGPGLLKIFGSELGHQLLPITFTGSMMAFVLSPLAQYFLLRYIDMDLLFQIQGSLVILVIFFIMQLKMKYNST